MASKLSLPPVPVDDRMPLPSRLGYVLLYVCGALGGLWQYADARVAFGVLAGAFFAFGVSFLPVRGGWPFLRWGLQVTTIVLALWWMSLRLKSTAIDLALVECAAMLGLALLMEPPASGYNVLSLVSLILVAYGGFIPLRHLYLPVVILFLVTGVWLLYRTRAAGLAGQRTHTVRQLRAYGQEWGFRTVHFVLFLLAWSAVFVLFPPGRHGTLGVFPVSFSTGQTLRYPKLWKDWWHAPWVQVDPEGTRLVDGETRVQELRPDAKTKTDAMTDGKSPTNEFGAGTGTIGQELVFRVKCDEKLYWLVRVYDEYDGRHWRASALLSRAGAVYLAPIRVPYRLVEQCFAIEKASSPWLPGAYEVDRVTWEEENLPAGAATDGRFGGGPLVRVVQGGIQFLDKNPPALPWRYRCRSRLSVFSEDKSFQQTDWGRAIQHLVTVPPKSVSKRVQELAGRITANGRTPMQKALALRDYLRQNYRYSLTAPQPPETCDPVDYFLFESREGSCSHFAQALTVLARLAGLPARVAAGYSPGNFNVVTGMFEVYEYHAHAWSQILIPPYGWLTFDGVAPGNLQLEAVPPVLGRLRDPFGDDWEAKVPEMMKAEQAEAAAREFAAAATEKAPPRVVAVVQKTKDTIVARAQRATRSPEPDAKSLARAAAGVAWDWLKELVQEVRGGWRSWLGALTWRLTHLWKLWTIALFRISDSAFAAMVVTGVIMLTVCLARNPVIRHWQRWRQRRRCDRLWNRLRQLRGEDAGTVVRLCYAFSTELLTLQGFRRQGNQDLFEYGEWIARRETEAGADLGIVFRSFVKAQFSPGGATQAEADAALAAARSLHRRTRPGGDRHLACDGTGSEHLTRRKNP